MAENEIGPMDRVYDLVTELLEEGSDIREILETAREAAHEWRIRKQISL